MAARYDFVVYGATGFTGAYIVRALATNPNTQRKTTVAVAGRSEVKLRRILDEISRDIAINVRDWPLIIADSSDSDSLAAMAKQSAVIINAVGPYRLYGEAVVKAAIENGANHVDVSGEPAFLERMQLEYGERAEVAGVYIVGACGWGSVPCDLGIDFLKKNFDGTLAYAETFVQGHIGPSGYSVNVGTYETMVLAIANQMMDGLGKMQRQLMPHPLPLTKHKPKKRMPLSRGCDKRQLQGRTLPFLTADKSIVQRSQYFDYFFNNKRPVHIETYIMLPSLMWSFLLLVWLSVFSLLAQFTVTRKLLLDYPDQASFGFFKKSGPTQPQLKETSFSYYIFGCGWKDKHEEEPAQPPDLEMTAVCRGPDPGYIGTSGCVVSAALALLQDKEKLPRKLVHGGVFTTASAFRETRIYEYLESFGITFALIRDSELS